MDGKILTKHDLSFASGFLMAGAHELKDDNPEAGLILWKVADYLTKEADRIQQKQGDDISDMKNDPVSVDMVKTSTETDLENGFLSLIVEALENGDPAENGLSDYDFVHNWGHIEQIVWDVFNEIGIVIKDREDRVIYADYLEAYWQTELKKGRWECLSKDVESL